MTQDFRQPSSFSAQPGTKSAADLLPPQRLVVALLRAAAVVSMLVGGWFWLSPPETFTSDVAPILALAFMASGVVDFGLAAFLAGYWRKAR